jgi:SpoVK/Ycf46/Vps4 family AAA+-type ATPase
MDMEPRSLSTLFFSNKEKEMICDHLDKFVNSSSFYKERQLLYKTGILLYGEPGTGKTSLIKAIGTTYGRSLVQIQVNNISDINLNSLVQSINADDVRQYIVVLEDIDTLFLNREMGDVTEDKTINKLLQFLDSNTSPNNVIFIATTNHLERLDKALLREGRFDLKVNIAPLLKKDAIKFINSFEIYGEDAEDILRELEKLGKFTKDDQGRIRYNQSSLQAMTLSKRNNKSLDDTIAMYGEMEDSSLQAEPEKENKKDEEELVDVPDEDDDDDDDD